MTTTKIGAAGVTYPDSTVQAARVPKLVATLSNGLNNYIYINGWDSTARRVVIALYDLQLSATTGWTITPYTSAGGSATCRTSVIRWTTTGPSSSNSSNSITTINLLPSTTPSTASWNGIIELQANHDSSPVTNWNIRWILSNKNSTYMTSMGSGQIYTSDGNMLAALNLAPQSGSITNGYASVNTY